MPIAQVNNTINDIIPERPAKTLTDLLSALGNKQLSFLDDDVKEERQIKLESTIDDIRRRFKYFSVQRALMLADKSLTDLNPKDDHVIFPVAYK